MGMSQGVARGEIALNKLQIDQYGESILVLRGLCARII
jgi:hypothetical protein